MERPRLTRAEIASRTYSSVGEVNDFLWCMFGGIVPSITDEMIRTTGKLTRGVREFDVTVELRDSVYTVSVRPYNDSYDNV